MWTIAITRVKKSHERTVMKWLTLSVISFLLQAFWHIQDSRSGSIGITLSFIFHSISSQQFPFIKTYLCFSANIYYYHYHFHVACLHSCSSIRSAFLKRWRRSISWTFEITCRPRLAFRVCNFACWRTNWAWKPSIVSSTTSIIWAYSRTIRMLSARSAAQNLSHRSVNSCNVGSNERRASRRMALIFGENSKIRSMYFWTRKKCKRERNPMTRWEW